MTPGHEKSDLSTRELEIVSAVVKGYTTREIAEILKLTQRAVAYDLYRIMEKLGVTTRAQLVLLWLQRGPEYGDLAGIAVKKPKGLHLNSGSVAASLGD